MSTETNQTLCTCDAQFSGNDEQRYRDAGCPSCSCETNQSAGKAREFENGYSEVLTVAAQLVLNNLSSHPEDQPVKTPKTTLEIIEKFSERQADRSINIKLGLDKMNNAHKAALDEIKRFKESYAECNSCGATYVLERDLKNSEKENLNKITALEAENKALKSENMKLNQSCCDYQGEQLQASQNENKVLRAQLGLAKEQRNDNFEALATSLRYDKEKISRLKSAYDDEIAAVKG